MSEIPRYDGVEEDPNEKGDTAPNSNANPISQADIDSFAELLASNPTETLDLSGIEGDNAIQKHLIGSEALKAAEPMSVDDFIKDIQEKGK